MNFMRPKGIYLLFTLLMCLTFSHIPAKAALFGSRLPAGGEGSGGGHFTKQDFQNYSYRILSLLAESKVVIVNNKIFDVDDLDKKLKKIKIEITKAPADSAKSFVEKNDVILLYENEFLDQAALEVGKVERKSDLEIAEIILRVFLNLVKIEDPGSRAVKALKQICKDRAEAESLIKKEVSAGHCVYGSELFCFSLLKKMSHNIIKKCDNGVVVACQVNQGNFVSESNITVGINLGLYNFYSGSCKDNSIYYCQ